MTAPATCLRCLFCSLSVARTASYRSTAVALPCYRSISSSSITRADAELERQREDAKKRAWYLDPADSEPTPATPIRAPGPRFTTFDPSSTLPTVAPSAPARPLPSNAPSHLKPLHAFLTTSELLEPSSVAFLHTPSATSLQRDAEELGIGGIGARWEWVVVAVVKGRGKGVVGRAERAVRLWLKDNPIPELSTSASPRRMPRVEAETDWSLVPIGESRACVNLFTQEGRDKWDLEDLFAVKDNA